MQQEAAFPLTPALSLGQGEPLPALEDARDPLTDPDRPKGIPSP
jgi:hypothetical protein